MVGIGRPKPSPDPQGQPQEGAGAKTAEKRGWVAFTSTEKIRGKLHDSVLRTTIASI